MINKQFLLTVLSFLFGIPLFGADGERPNILFIFTDDRSPRTTEPFHPPPPQQDKENRAEYRYLWNLDGILMGRSWIRIP